MFSFINAHQHGLIPSDENARLQALSVAMHEHAAVLGLIVYDNGIESVTLVMQGLMAKYEAVNRAGWQAFGAIQALLSREAVLKDLTLNELQSLFRHAVTLPPLW